MNLKLVIAFLLLAILSNAQPQILDKVTAIVGKNPLLLSEVETNLLQQKEQKEKKEITQEDRCKIFEDLLLAKNSQFIYSTFYYKIVL